MIDLLGLIAVVSSFLVQALLRALGRVKERVKGELYKQRTSIAAVFTFFVRPSVRHALTLKNPNALSLAISRYF